MLESAEAQLERFVHLEAGIVRRNLVAIRAPQQPINRLAGVLAADVPQRQIHSADRHNRDALASVEQRGVVHLLPKQLHV